MTRPHKALRVWRSAFVLVLVLVLEDVVFSEVAELRESAGSELHPRSGLGMLKGRKILIRAGALSAFGRNLIR
jgi:hypothetical protein